ncbi:hypothetical protein BDM02DRAFT_241 [Thelephora ganbajun]|uniref:Uncharacterized protein n=1 Tax=Thelephora ganbajun TaxID=370292 RepID=A0ACB6ZX85_THEGA|nr:hypothetical protein BDM02DRAFT_241 [Thelephora ganbajun]
MNVTTEAKVSPSLASLAISPNLQALLEFDDRLRTSSESHEQPMATPADLVQPNQYPSWGKQEVPTVSLPPPRRKKSVVTGVPMSPKTIFEFQSVASPTNIFPGVGESGGLGEIMFARPEGVLEDEMESKDSANPYLNSPPSSPRYFYPRSDDEEGIDQPSPFYTLEKSRPMRRLKRQRSFSDQSPVERKGGQLVSPRYFTSFGRNVGSRPREKGAFSFFFFFFSFFFSLNPGLSLSSKVSGPRAAVTRPFLLHRHKASLSSAHSHQTGTSYEPASSPEPYISISSTIYSASSIRSLPTSPSPNASPVRGSFIDLGSPPMSPSSDVGSHEYQSAKSTISHNNSPRSSNSHSRSSSPLPKPPIPTTPKPVFNRPHSFRRSMIDDRPKVEDPPTTILSSAERAELVKKTRKLTQLFGQTPGPDLASLSPVVTSPLQQSHLSPDVRKGHRVITSISNPLHPSDKGVWPPPEETLYLNINGRRHSTPLSPTTISTMWGSNEDDSILDHDQRSFRSNKFSRVWLSRKEDSSPIASAIPSPMSFIDLSDDDSAAETPKDITDHQRQAPFSRESTIDDTASLLTLTSTEVHEEEQRRKREKLVKLHRFLGSRVPADLVLGLDFGQSPTLPSPAFPDVEPGDTRKKFRMRRRRSSSFAEYTRPLIAREDRMKSELDMQEKALNVRRAAKMEKVFGVAPPQTLYHTRKSDPPTPQSSGQAPILSVDINMPPTLAPLDPLSFFTMPGFGNKGKKSKRPSTADSSQALISRNESDSSIEVYNSYRESLNSLTEIVDKDDKASLKLIHDILHANDDDDDDRAKRKVDDDDYDSSEPDIPSTSTRMTTIRYERRSSLPSCPSITSLHSEYSITSPPEISTFEQKRRRAAKLTNFFGVNHRDIMSDILESIESGVAEERGRGTLNQAQADVRPTPPFFSFFPLRWNVD